MRIVDDCDKALKTAIEKEADGQILPIYIPACENIMDQISSTHTKTYVSFCFNKIKFYLFFNCL